MTEITDDLPARLLHEEHTGWQAILAGRGGEYFHNTMTRDARLIVPEGFIDREHASEALGAAQPWDAYEIREPAVVRLNERAGILVYRAVLTRGDDVRQLLVSTTYLFDNGGWCVAAHQQTPA